MPKSSTQEKPTFADLRPAREYKNYVDGEWARSSSGKTFENRNPADREDLIGTFQESNADDLNAAEEIFSRLMGEEVEPRREFIEANALNVRNLDI